MRHSLCAERFALGSYPYYRYSMDYFLDTAQQLGFSAVELWAASPQIDLEALSPTFCRALHQKLKERGLHTVALTPEQCNYPYNLAAEDEELRKKSIRYFSNGVELAAQIESPWLLVSAGSGYYDHSREEALARSLDSLSQVAQYADAKGVSLLFETLTPVSSNLINSPEQVANALLQLPQNVRGMLDIGQMTVMNQTPEQYFAALGENLCHVHLHDTGAACHMVLGEGELDIPFLLNKILQTGYSGSFALECNDARYRADPRAADLKNHDYLFENGWLK